LKKTIVLFVFLFTLLFQVDAQFKETYYDKGKRAMMSENFTAAIEFFNYSLSDRKYFQAFFFRGYSKFKLGDLAGAEVDFTACLSEISNHKDALFYRAVVRDQMSNFEGAFEDYELALKYDSTNAKIYLNRAITLLSLEQFEATIDDCNQAIRLNKSNVNSYVIRAIAKSELKDYESALADFNYAIGKKMDNSFAMVYRAECYRKMGKIDLARADLATVLERDSTNVDGMYQLALLELDQSNFKIALKLMDQVIAVSPYNSLALFNRAITKTNLKDFNGALADYDAVITANPKHVGSYFNRGLIKQQMGDLKGALADFDQLIEIMPRYADAYGARAQLKQQLGDRRGAEQDQQMLAQVRINNETALRAGLSSEEMQAAIESKNLSSDGSNVANDSGKVQYQHTEIRLRPYYYLTPELFSEVAEDYYQSKEPSINSHLIGLMSAEGSWDAKKLNHQIDSLDKIQGIKDAAFYLKRAILFTQTEQYNQAFQDFDSSIALQSKNVLAYFGRANTALKLRELLNTFPDAQQFKKVGDKITSEPITKEYEGFSYSSIIQDYQKAIQFDNQFTYAYYNLAYVQNKNGQFEESLSALNRAIELKPDFAQAYFNRGLTHLFLKKTDLGCRDLGKSGELGIKEAYNIMLRYCKK